MDHGRILVLESDSFVALDIEGALREHGFSKITICDTMDAFQNEIDKRLPDVALIDPGFAGELSGIKVAAHLDRMSCPVIFITFAETLLDLPEDLRHCHVVEKPFRDRTIHSELDRIFAERTASE